MLNRNYGRLDESGKIIYAPTQIKIGDTYFPAPNAAQYASKGWLPVIDERPTAREGIYAVTTGWVEQDGVIGRVYEERAVEPPPPPVRHFSKLKLYCVLSAQGLWDAVCEWMATRTVETDGVTMNAKTAFDLAQDLTDNHPMFSKLLAESKAAFGFTDEQVDALLSTIEYDPMEA